MIEMRGVSKSFPGVLALDNVSFRLKPGSVHALMGENGAGKSTLMKCLFGVYKKDSGEIYLDGRRVDFQNTKDALDGGVAMVHQELNQAGSLSVMENMWLGRLPRVWHGLPIISRKRMYNLTRDIFKELGIDTDPTAMISTLSVSKRQTVEIAKAYSYNARVIVFDEPTSSLNDEEAEKLFEIIDMLKKKGCGIIYISHKMEEILRISDEVTVMRDGRHIATRSAKEITTDDIIRLMVGRELTNRYPPKTNKPGGELLYVEGISGEHSLLRDASFVLHKGEILGIAGLDGSGRTELVETVFGERARRGGRITLDGKDIENRSAREAIKEGFALVTEERRRSGILGILSILENTTISSLKRFNTGGIISKKRLLRLTEESIKRLRIKTPSAFTKISNLSGGNQQKVIFARWLITEPRVLLLDEPTRGIDVGAKYEIYKLISTLASEGKGVVVVSSEMAELIGICDRILVMSAGRIAGELDAKSVTQEKIMELATRFL